MDTNDNPLRRLIAAGLVALLACFLFFAAIWFIKTGRVVVVLPASDQPYTMVAINQESGEIASTRVVKGTRLGWRLPAGDYEIRITSDNRATSHLVSVGRFLRSTKISVDVNNQSGREKLARNTVDCPVIGGSKLFSYTCDWSQTLFSHAPTSAVAYANTEEFSVPGIMNAYSYGDGLLALRFVDGSNTPVLSVIQNGVVVSSKVLPEEFGTGGNEQVAYSLVMDRKNTDSFVVVKRSDTVALLYYQNLNTQPVGTTINYDETNISDLVSTVDLYDGRILVALGESGNAHQDDLKSDENTEPVPTNIRFFTVGNSIERTGEETLDTEFTQVRFCGSQYVCLLAEDQLQIFDLDDDNLHKTGTLNDVLRFTSLTDNSIAYQQGSAVFLFNVSDRAGRMIFSSPRFSVSNLSAASGRVLLTATETDSSQGIIHAFLVDTKAAADNFFVDNALPYPPGTISELQDMDFHNQTILMTILLHSAVLNDNGGVEYDQAEYDRVTGEILTRLAKDGFLEPTYDINFIVSY